MIFFPQLQKIKVNTQFPHHFTFSRKFQFECRDAASYAATHLWATHALSTKKQGQSKMWQKQGPSVSVVPASWAEDTKVSPVKMWAILPASQHSDQESWGYRTACGFQVSPGTPLRPHPRCSLLRGWNTSLHFHSTTLGSDQSQGATEYWWNRTRHRPVLSLLVILGSQKPQVSRLFIKKSCPKVQRSTLWKIALWLGT